MQRMSGFYYSVDEGLLVVATPYGRNARHLIMISKSKSMCGVKVESFKYSRSFRRVCKVCKSYFDRHIKRLGVSWLGSDVDTVCAIVSKKVNAKYFVGPSLPCRACVSGDVMTNVMINELAEYEAVGHAVKGWAQASTNPTILKFNFDVPSDFKHRLWCTVSRAMCAEFIRNVMIGDSGKLFVPLIECSRGSYGISVTKSGNCCTPAYAPKQGGRIYSFVPKRISFNVYRYTEGLTEYEKTFSTRYPQSEMIQWLVEASCRVSQ